MPTGLTRSNIALGAVGLAFVVFIVALVAGSLTRPEVATFIPSPAEPREVGDAAVGPLTYTVDARSPEDWVYFDFSRGSVVETAGPPALDWDIAFRRHRMITNGGDTNPLGQAGVAELSAVPLDSTTVVPEEGFVTDERRGDESRNRALESWYDYSWLSHILEPADRVYAVRTADGRYAILRFVGYYCPGGQSGCVTFRYRYRGDGARRFAVAPASGICIVCAQPQ